MIAMLLLAACGAPAVSDAIQPADVTAPQSEPPEAPVDPPVQAAAPPDGEVRLDDLIYPDAEFLFEIPGFGGPMVPWRFYALHGTSIEQATAFYIERLSHFGIEYDEVVGGYRSLLLAHPSPMAQLQDVQDFDEMARISRELDGTLLGVEISHNGAHAQQNRLGLAISAHERGDEIPDNTTILILEYFANVY
jgi:hypothetical protein